jgi:hypothetical protein
MEDYLGPEYALLAEIAGRVRRRLWRRGVVSSAAWNRALDGELLELLRRGEIEKAERRLEESLTVKADS